MAKLTREQRGELLRILHDITRANEYVTSERTALCYVRRVATTTEDFTRQKDDRVLLEVDKQIGSNITGLYDAKKRLERFLAD